MDELFIVKAILEIKDSKGDITADHIIREREFKEPPTDEEIMAMKQEFHADRCEVVKVYR